MTKFKVGDQVERIDSLIPEYVRSGTIIQVIQNEDGIEWFTQYEVNFGVRDIAIFYETQLRLVEPPTSK